MRLHPTHMYNDGMAVVKIIIVYYTKQGATENMARAIAHGVESEQQAEACLRTVPEVYTQAPRTVATPSAGPPYLSVDELRQCDGLAMGSPTRFGEMAAPLHFFWQQTTALWLEGALIGKPAGVFSSSGSLHGGQESTLLSMMLPLMHHGMVLCTIPYSEEALIKTQTGGTPYGPSHVAGERGDRPLSVDEKKLCWSFGRRLASTAIQLKSS